MLRRHVRTLLPRTALALAACALVGCAQIPTRPSSGLITDVPWDVAPAAQTSLTRVYGSERARLDAGERVWQLIADRYYDPRMNGVDWLAVRNRHLPRVAAAGSDAELYRALKAMAAELRDSHTQVLTPREAVDSRRFVAPRFGLLFGKIDERIALLEVEPDSPAAAAGLRAGDVLLAINGVALDAAFIAAALADPGTLRAESTLGDGPEALPSDARDAERVRVVRAVARVFRQAGGASPEVPARVRLDVQQADGRLRTVELLPAARARPPQASSRWLDNGVLLIRFNRFHPDVRDEVERALEAAAPARAVIIDLRGNGGGLLDLYRTFAGQFLPDERVPMRATRRERAAAGTQSVTDLKAGPRGRPLLMPLAVLIDSRSGSAAELMAVTLAEQRNALLVGEPSCGCVVGVRVEYVLPDGGGVRIGETGFVSARGARMEGEPTPPQVRVVPTLADLRAGRDVVLDEAWRRLQSRLSR
jgi:carboxyl-terminal processing protease